MTYSILVINTHLKTLNVLSFYSSVAFIIKAMAAVFKEIPGYAVMFFFFVLMFSLGFNALDIVWYSSSSPNKESDEVGLGGMAAATYFATIRNSIGDFQINTFKYPEQKTTIAVWVLFLIMLVLQFFLMMNFAIQIAEGGYGSVAKTQKEQAYQQKCKIICELNDVFGSFVPRKPNNILVTRLFHKVDLCEGNNTTVQIFRKQSNRDRFESYSSIVKLRNAVQFQNSRIHKEMTDLKRIISNYKFPP